MRPPLIPLNEDLISAIESGILITQTARQAYELKYAWTYHNVQNDVLAFPSPQIYSFDGWLQRIYEKFTCMDLPFARRILVTHPALRLAFQLCAPDTEFEKHVQATTRAWRTYVEWNLHRVGPDLDSTENGQLFRKWVQRFQAFQNEHEIITFAELPALVTQAITTRHWCPSKVTFFGLEDLSPVRREVINQLIGRGCKVTELPPSLLESKSHRTEKFESSNRELSTLGTWVRALLSKYGHNYRIGVIVPDLASGAPRIRSQFEASFYDCHSIDRIVNIGLGFPLRETRLCKDVLQLLDWTIRDLAYEEILQLGRSPYLVNLAIPATFPGDYPDRMYFRDYLRRVKQGTLTPELQTIAKRFPKKKRGLEDWAQFAVKLLDSAGWKLHTNIESERAQAAFMLLFKEFAKLSPLLGYITWPRAVGLIGNALRTQNLTVDIRDTPVQILSRDEAAGLVFDALWVTGISEESWPPKVDLNPMIPIVVQRKAQVPRVTQGQMLNWAKRVSENWAKMAPNTIFSFVDDEPEDKDDGMEGSRLLERHQTTNTSALLEHVKLTERDHPWGTNPRENLVRQFTTESGTKLPVDQKRISTSAIRDQSLCPFRAWAIHRLNLREASTPHRLPDPMERGTDVHKLTERLLTKARSHKVICKLGNEDIEEAVDHVLKERAEKLPARFIKHERKRLIDIAENWLEFERKRENFSVIAVEKEYVTMIEGLDVHVRVDRIDKTKTLSCLVIDCKTGQVSTNNWLPPRLQEIQMPLYALAIPKTDGLAYLKIRAKEKISMKGMVANKGVQKQGLEQVPVTLGGSFPKARVKWKSMLKKTVKEFKNGDARVEPVDVKTTCNNCHLSSFCREFTDITFQLNAPLPDDRE